MSRQLPLHPNSQADLKRRPSVLSNVSGIADSTISFGGLSLFPNPPESIPTTPKTDEFQLHPSPPPSTIGSSRLRYPTNPNQAHDEHVPMPDSPSIVAGSHPRQSERHQPPVASQRQNSKSFSIRNWQDGASNISMDTTEDGLLSTSFITSLLQESDSRSMSPSARHSLASDAFSGFSEISYPPVSRPPARSSAFPKTHVHSRARSSSKPHGARPPPSSFNRSSKRPDTLKIDTELPDNQSDQDHDFPVEIRSANRVMVSPGSVLGAAPRPLGSIISEQGASYDGLYDKEMHTARVSRQPDLSTHASNDASEYSIGESQLPVLPNRNVKDRGHSRGRYSVHSSKSTAPSFLSRVSSTGRAIFRRKRKPLPPVPLIPDIPVAAEIENRRVEASMPLPHLLSRATQLGNLLDSGYQPHQSMVSNGKSEGGDTYEPLSFEPKPHQRDQFSFRSIPGAGSLEGKKFVARFTTMPGRRRFYVIIFVFVIIAAIAVGTGVGVTVSRKKPGGLPVCSGTMTGASCTLNAACVCTSNVDGVCDGLAQHIVDLIPTTNLLFNSNLTAQSTYEALWLAEGLSSLNSCAPQAMLVDVAPALDAASFPNRTQWAQAALLWNVVRSGSVGDTQKLRSFVKDAPWSRISGSDGPTDDASGQFIVTASGYAFDFALQEIGQTAVSFTEDGQPTSAQISRVGDAEKATLDRMYSFALASSTQRQTALSTYWTGVLMQGSQDLSSFLGLLYSSPILLPFDASSDSLRALWNDSSVNTFPPPLACYPNLNDSHIQAINAVERNVFSLPSLSNASSFQSSCFDGRPIYGVLDVLRLRLPFIDSEPRVAKQAVTLVGDVRPRALFHRGETLASFPSASAPSNFQQPDVKDYGTYNHLNHVVLDYLTSMPSVSVAQALISFLLSSPSGPPANDTLLGRSVTNIPSIEVAVFGDLPQGDISTVSSSLTTSDGSLFFGSSAGDDLRNWAITNGSHTLVWAETAVSSRVVRDSKLSETFEKIWSAAATGIRERASDVGVSNITSSFDSTGLYSS